MAQAVGRAGAEETACAGGDGGGIGGGADGKGVVSSGEAVELVAELEAGGLQGVRVPRPVAPIRAYGSCDRERPIPIALILQYLKEWRKKKQLAFSVRRMKSHSSDWAAAVSLC